MRYVHFNLFSLFETRVSIVYTLLNRIRLLCYCMWPDLVGGVCLHVILLFMLLNYTYRVNTLKNCVCNIQTQIY